MREKAGNMPFSCVIFSSLPFRRCRGILLKYNDRLVRSAFKIQTHWTEKVDPEFPARVGIQNSFKAFFHSCNFSFLYFFSFSSFFVFCRPSRFSLILNFLSPSYLSSNFSWSFSPAGHVWSLELSSSFPHSSLKGMDITSLLD